LTEAALPGIGPVEAQNGMVKVGNRQTMGIRFTITIPVEIPEMKNIKPE
jgi:hypothetical protein